MAMHESELHKMFAFERHHWWFEGRRKVLRGLLARYLPDRGVEILDAGCGTGHHLIFLDRLGYRRAQGVDLSPLAIRFCARLGLRNAETGDVTRLRFSAEKFDAVILLDVLEHLADDTAGLRECWRVLKPGGIAILTVPAFTYLWSHHDEVLGHHRRYRRADLRRLAAATGFTLVRQTYIYCIIFPLVAAYRFVSKAFRFDRTSDLEATAEPFNSILKLFATIEVGLIRRRVDLPFGTSLAVVLHKPASATGE
ncbi:MAG: class I SAM-dependent methyltransferase [Patescibacteria group bacterium]|nr:class I SAM-dependent methyltransferase [Patescibacteria group bacterium]